MTAKPPSNEPNGPAEHRADRAIVDGTDDATTIVRLVKSGELSPSEIATAAEQRCSSVNGRINAVVEWYSEPDRLESAADGPLAGVPIVAKDYGSAVEGRLVEMGSRMAEGNRAKTTAAYMHRLLRAGAQIVGRSATPEFIQHGTTESARFGATRNPHRTDFSAGGSSGGAAAAVAAGIAPIAHASDCAGSIRIPAATNGLVGLKPGGGRVPWTNTSAASDWGGIASEFVVTKTVTDAKLLLDVLGDGQYLPTKRRYSIGVSTDHWAGVAPDSEVVATTEAVSQLLTDAGHSVDTISPPVNYEQLMSTWHGLFSRWVAAEVDQLTAQTGLLPSIEVVEPMTLAALEAVRPLEPVDLLELERRKVAIERRLKTETILYDIVLTPTLGRVAIPLDHVSGQVTSMDDYLQRNDELFPYNYLFNVARWPSISVPAGTSSAAGTEGMPIGVQLSARPESEHQLLDLAQLIIDGGNEAA